jgi:hypothetical protein
MEAPSHQSQETNIGWIQKSIEKARSDIALDARKSTECTTA